jgi:hypothetical protein
MQYGVTAWKAWFVDVPQTKILRFSSDDITWEELPYDGCIAIKYYSKKTLVDGTQETWQLHGYDWYFKADGIIEPIYGCDIDQRERNVKEELNKRYNNVNLIRGIWVDDVIFNNLMNEMREA